MENLKVRALRTRIVCWSLVFEGLSKRKVRFYEDFLEVVEKEGIKTKILEKFQLEGEIRWGREKLSKESVFMKAKNISRVLYR